MSKKLLAGKRTTISGEIIKGASKAEFSKPDLANKDTANKNLRVRHQSTIVAQPLGSARKNNDFSLLGTTKQMQVENGSRKSLLQRGGLSARLSKKSPQDSIKKIVLNFLRRIEERGEINALELDAWKTSLASVFEKEQVSEESNRLIQLESSEAQLLEKIMLHIEKQEGLNSKRVNATKTTATDLQNLETLKNWTNKILSSSNYRQRAEKNPTVENVSEVSAEDSVEEILGARVNTQSDNAHKTLREKNPEIDSNISGLETGKARVSKSADRENVRAKRKKLSEIDLLVAKVTPKEFDENYYQNYVNDFLHRKQEHIQQESARQKLEEAQNLTFQPTLSKYLSNSKLSSQSSVYERLNQYQSQLDLKLEKLREETLKERENERAQVETFKPKINRQYFSTEEGFHTAVSFFSKDPVAVLTQRDAKNSPKEAQMTSTEIQNFHPILNNMSEKIAELYITETSPDVAERMLLFSNWKKAKLEQLIQQNQPTFVPKISPFAERLFQRKAKGDTLNQPTMSNLSYIAAQAELREKLNRMQVEKESYFSGKSRSKSAGLRSSRSASNLQNTAAVNKNQGSISSHSDLNSHMIENLRSKGNFTDNDLIEMLRQMRKTLGLGGGPEEDLGKKSLLEDPGSERIEYLSKKFEENLQKLQNLYQNTQPETNYENQTSDDRRVFAEGGFFTTRSSILSGDEAVKRAEPGSLKRISKLSEPKSRNSLQNTRQNKQKTRVSVYPDYGMFNEGDKKRTSLKKKPTTKGKKLRKRGNVGGQTRSEEPHQKLRKERTRISCYPDEGLFTSTQEDEETERSKSRERSSSNRDRSLPEDKRSRTDIVGEMFDINEEEEYSRGLPRGVKRTSSSVQRQRSGSSRNSSRERKSIYPDNKMFEERGAKKSKSRTSVYPEKGMFDEKESKKPKTKSRVSVYPDREMFSGGDPEEQAIDQRESLTPDKKKAGIPKNLKRESVYPDNHIFEEADRKEEEDSSNILNSKRKQTEEENKRSECQERGSVYPDEGMFTEPEVNPSRGQLRESVYPGAELFTDPNQEESSLKKQKRPKKMRSKNSEQRDSVYPDAGLFKEMKTEEDDNEAESETKNRERSETSGSMRDRAISKSSNVERASGEDPIIGAEEPDGVSNVLSGNVINKDEGRIEEREQEREQERERFNEVVFENENLQRALALSDQNARKVEEQLQRLLSDREFRRSRVRIDNKDSFTYSPDESKSSITKPTWNTDDLESLPKSSELFEITLFNKDLRNAPKESQTLKNLGKSTKNKFLKNQKIAKEAEEKNRFEPLHTEGSVERLRDSEFGVYTEESAPNRAPMFKESPDST